MHAYCTAANPPVILGRAVPNPVRDRRRPRTLPRSAMGTMPGLSADCVKATRKAEASSPEAVADVAQLVEHFTRNEGVRGSSPRVGL